MTPVPLVVSCPGSSEGARLAASVAGGLVERGLVRTGSDAETGTEVVAIDGCGTGCGSRLAAARGASVTASVDLADGTASSGALDLEELTNRVAKLLERGPRPARTARPAPPERPERHAPGESHDVDDYALALDKLTSPVVGCGVVVGEAPTLAAHVSGALGVTRAAAGEMLAKMEASGLVRRGPRKELLLTPAGRERADACARRQRLLEVFVTSVLGYGLAESFDRARSLRPAFDDDAIDRLERSLGSPARCPHGWLVDHARSRAESASLRTLASVGTGETTIVVLLAEEDARIVEELAEAGIVPGACVHISASSGDVLSLEIGGSPASVDQRTAQAVMVSAESA